MMNTIQNLKMWSNSAVYLSNFSRSHYLYSSELTQVASFCSFFNIRTLSSSRSTSEDFQGAIPYRHKAASKVILTGDSEKLLDRAEDTIDRMFTEKGIGKNMKRHLHFRKKWKERTVKANNLRRKRDIVDIKDTIEWIEYRRRNKVPNSVLLPLEED
mmetsp:Transcript_33802/g.42635  ORF Transcript_33802/g.42635 Transcript_33802/m.42635 type:complete len:157 (-) Transcript_33802:211-681(-)